jgi:hypothetical protein
MAEPVTRTPDFPDFDTYPGPTPKAGRLLPVPEKQGQSGMNQVGEKVGSTLGSAVSAARRLPQQLSSTLSSAKDRLVLVKGRTASEVNSRAGDLKEAASDKARQAQERARLVAREYPLHVLAGVAALAFVAGFALRIWRGSRG